MVDNLSFASLTVEDDELPPTSSGGPSPTGNHNYTNVATTPTTSSATLPRARPSRDKTPDRALVQVRGKEK